MTFDLVRIGWPNTAAILALAIDAGRGAGDASPSGTPATGSS